MSQRGTKEVRLTREQIEVLLQALSNSTEPSDHVAMTEQNTEGAELPPGCHYGEPNGDVRGRVYWGSELVATGYTRGQACERAWKVFGDGPRAAYLDMKAKAERCEAAEYKADVLSRAMEYIGEDVRLRIADVGAQVSDARERLVTACHYAVESAGMSEGQACALLNVERVECRRLLDEAKSIHWLTRNQGADK